MLIWFVIVPVLTAIFLFLLPFRKTGKIIAMIVQAALACFAFYVFMICRETDLVVKIGNYYGFLGITLKADNLSSVFVMLGCFIFLIGTLYSLYENADRLFWFLLFVWEGLLNGIFLSCDFFNIYVLMEVATITVSVLIMFNRDNRSMYDGMVYLMVNTAAIQFFLFGTGYIYKITGALDIDSAAIAIQSIDKSRLILPYALIMTSVGLKCALAPMFGWLPRAHGTPGAPSVVSAVLSGLHIKSAVYLFIRFQSVFGQIAVPDFFLAAGIITAIAGFILALSQSDLKLILAYSTISQIGLIMAGLNITDPIVRIGSMYHIMNHAVFKSALFLCAGIITGVYGTRDIRKIRGVLKRMPLVGAAALMAVLGITGTPFFNGSISKYFIMSGTNWAVNGIFIFMNLGTITLFIKLSSIFFGHSDSVQGTVKIEICRQAAVLIPGIICFAGGIFGEQAINFLFNADIHVDAAGYLQKAGLFALTLAAGFVIYRFFITKAKFFGKIRTLELGFRGICVSMGIFFAVLLVCTRLMN
ncbi:MAG: hypothetical protein FWF22_02230 [Treponema sp.]|nr:hypothetical protein [Treponema sp.]